MTPNYRRCPRLVSFDGGGDRSAQAPWSRPAVRRPELQRAGSRYAGRTRRPLSLTEVTVLTLGLSIIFALLFIVYAIVHRLWIGPGMWSASPVAGGLEVATAEPPATLVPTFTPTPLSAEVAPLPTSVTSGLPTPVPEPSLPTPTPVGRLAATSPPTRLLIPDISVDIPVLAVGTKTIRKGPKTELVWDDVPNAAGFHQTSAYPGNPGNTVINGHRDIYGAVFRHLDKVEAGDEIILYVGDVAYPYYVTETLVVPETFASARQRAENLKYIGHVPEERLTLVTCTPIGLATHRLLIIAKPPEQVMPQMPEAGSDTGS